MLKKFSVFLLIISLLCVIPVYAVENQTDKVLNIQFDTDVIRVGNTGKITVSVPNGVSKVTAYINDNGKLSLKRDGMVYDYKKEMYCITFTPENGIYNIEFTARYTGLATIEFRETVLYTGENSENADNVQADITVKPNAVEIYTKQDLNRVREDLSGDYMLMNDIVFSEEDFLQGGEFYNDGYGWQPIGSSLYAAFTGTFDGNGYAVKGLKVNKANYNYIGMFGVNKGKIENLALSNISINAVYGVFVPEKTNNTTSNSGKIDYESKDVWTVPSGNVNDSDLSSYDRSGLSSAIAGAVAGYNIGEICDCYVNGNISATPVAGGITASNTGTVERCYGNVNVTAKTAGALAGYNINHAEINNCHTKGKISGSVLAGGICGENRSSKITESYSVCKVLGENIAGASNGIYYSTLSNVYFLNTEGLSDTYAEAVSKEDLSKLTFKGDCWDHSLDYPVLKALKSYISKEPADDVVQVKKGDVNNDGSVDATDLAILKKIIAGLTDGIQIEKMYPNVDGDPKGNVDATDLAILKKLIAGVI